MADSLTRAIEARLQRYLAGEDSLAEFEAWLVPETWDISPQSDRSAHDLATEITLRIAEFTNGAWSEDELQEALGRLQLRALPEFSFSGGKEEQIMLGFQGHQAAFSVVGTAHSGAAA